jgi:hypothetical protein
MRLQIVPYEGGDSSDSEKKQHRQDNLFGYATVPWTSTRTAGISPRPIRQYDPELAKFVGISAQGFQWLGRIGPENQTTG